MVEKLTVSGVAFGVDRGVRDLGLGWWMISGVAKFEFRVRNLGLYVGLLIQGLREVADDYSLKNPL